MNRHFAPWALFLLVCAGSARAQDVTIQFLHASDLEGGVEAVERAPNFSAIVEGLESDAATAGFDSILLSAGDNYIPGPFFNAAGNRDLRDELQAAYQTLFGESGLTNVREGPGRVDITIMNILGFDASAVGNHEFDNGPNTFAGLIGTDIRGTTLGDVRWLGAQFPYLSANLDFSQDADLNPLFTNAVLNVTEFRSPPGDLAAAAAAPKVAPSAIITRSGQKIGVVGATTQLLESITSNGDVTVIGPNANDMPALAGILQPVVDALTAQGVNKIVLVSHLQQISLEQTLIGLLRDVDIVIAGGSDTVLANAGDRLLPGDTAAGAYPLVTQNANNQTAYIVSTNGEYSYVGRLIVTFDVNGVIKGPVDPRSGPKLADETGVLEFWASTTEAFAEGTKGGEVKKLTDALLEVINTSDGNVFGKTDVFLEGRRTEVRTQETNLGNLTARANLAAARAVDKSVLVSHKNGGGIRAPIGEIDGESGALLPPPANPGIKKAGEISQLNIENSLRFNNGLTLITLTPQQLKQVLEHAVAQSGPGATPGRFAQLAGVAFSFDPRDAPGSRVKTIKLTCTTKQPLVYRTTGNGKKGLWIRKAPIRIVTLNFLANGGDSYPFPDFVAANPKFANRVDLVVAGKETFTGAATFAPDGSEQDALAEFIAANFSVTPFDEAEVSPENDLVVQDLSIVREDTVIRVRSGLPGTKRK